MAHPPPGLPLRSTPRTFNPYELVSPFIHGQQHHDRVRLLAAASRVPGLQRLHLVISEFEAAMTARDPQHACKFADAKADQLGYREHRHASSRGYPPRLLPIDLKRWGLDREAVEKCKTQGDAVKSWDGYLGWLRDWEDQHFGLGGRFMQAGAPRHPAARGRRGRARQPPNAGRVGPFPGPLHPGPARRRRRP